MKWVILLAIAVAFTGCRLGFQKERNLTAIHILGVGWIFQRHGTNIIRVFGLGSVNATAMSSAIQTNAPFTMDHDGNEP